jgi:heavy metal translocating P-type ATPase
MNGSELPQYCAFCGLPLPKNLAFGREQSNEDVDYCCSGCRAVAHVDQATGEQGQAANSLMRLGLAVFFTMNVMVFTMALWSQDVYPEQSFKSELSTVLRSVFRWGSLVFSAPILWLLGGPIAQGVWQALRRRAITTDLLILLGVTAAYAFSVVSVLRGEGHVYFEVGSMVLVFVSLGRWLEAKGKRRTGESLDALASLLPDTVRRLDAQGVFQETPREEVVTGDLVRVLPGERFPIDGRILNGNASVDEQMVSGESRSVEKSPGAKVFSGTLNLDGDLRIEVTAADGRETLSRLIALVRTARSTKGRQELLADRIATWFVPVVCLIALAAGWRQGWAEGIDQGILTGLAVVLIACPCALGLATPMAVWTALGRAAECGVLFRSGMVMQQLASIRFACFDKTGTLTSGKPSVESLLVGEQDQFAEVLMAAASVTAGSTHPLSQAITHFFEQQANRLQPRTSSLVETLAGRGLRSEVSGLGAVLLGSRRLMDESGLVWPEHFGNLQEDDKNTQQVFVGWGGEVRGVFCFAEVTRPEAIEAVAACRKLGMELQLLTGDGSRRAEAIGEQFTVATKSDQLPDDKVAAVKELAEQGAVAMIGDGLNDAPALAAATVGVALGCGADVSRDAAGVCLLADDLRRFPWAVGLARQANRIVKQNLFWAFTYNCIGIALAATGRLNPIWAALAMAVSSLLVVTNSLRLAHYPESLTASLDKTVHASINAVDPALEMSPQVAELSVTSS